MGGATLQNTKETNQKYFSENIDKNKSDYYY